MKEAIIGEPLLTVAAIAKDFHSDRRTIEALVERGELPRPDLRLAGRPRWKRSTLVNWLAKHQAELAAV